MGMGQSPCHQLTSLFESTTPKRSCTYSGFLRSSQHRWVWNYRTCCTSHGCRLRDPRITTSCGLASLQSPSPTGPAYGDGTLCSLRVRLPRDSQSMPGMWTHAKQLRRSDLNSAHGCFLRRSADELKTSTSPLPSPRALHLRQTVAISLHAVRKVRKNSL